MTARNGNLGFWTALALLAALAPAATAAPASADPKRGRLPEAVAAAVDANCPGATIAKLETENEGGVKLYDIEFKDGREIEVAEDGTVIDVATLVQMADVPEPAAAAIKRAAGNGTIRQLERSEVRSRVETAGGRGRVVRLEKPEYVYEAELGRGGEVEVAADGRVIKAPGGGARESTTPK